MGISIIIGKNITAEKRYVWRTLGEVIIFFVLLIIIIFDPLRNAKASIDSKKMQINKAANLDDFSILKTKIPIDPSTLVLLYMPDNVYTKKIMTGVSEALKLGTPIGYNPGGVKLKDAFDQNRHLAAIDFGKMNDNAKNVLYVLIRYPSKFRSVKPSALRNMFWMTRCSGMILTSEDSKLEDAGIDLYIREGFLQLQHQIFVQWLATLPSPPTAPKVTVRGVFNEFDGDCDVNYSSPLTALLYYLCFLYPFLNLIQRLAQERENNVLVHHRMYGFQYWHHWVAHFIVSFGHFLALSIIFVIITKNPWIVSTHTSDVHFSIYILFLALYSCALIVTAMTIVCMMVETINCVLFGIFMWIASCSLFVLLLNYENKMHWGWVFTSYVVFFNNSLDRGMAMLSDVSDADIVENYITLFVGLCGNILLYSILMWHFQHYRPGRYVQRKRYNFLQLGKLCSPKTKRQERMRTVTITERGVSWHNFENPPVDGETVVKLINVCTFHDSDKKLHHLQKVSLRAFRGEITVLVGHNGSGKTTILCSIAGLKEPEAGRVSINDVDVYDKDGQSYIDVCFEKNPLFQFLTVSETLTYFITIKMQESDEDKVNIEKRKWIRYITMAVPSEDEPIRMLSFEQARLVYLCCMMCCDTEVILLDEPTKRMGFKHRRLFWEIVRQEKPKRAIIVATNSNEEAQMVADRIGVLNNGVLNAYGTGFFLRSKFGVGYDLIILTEPNANTHLITAVVSKYFPHILPDNQIGDQVFYKLPFKGTPLFQRMLLQLERESPELGIKTIEVTSSELSEVNMNFGMRKYRQTLPENEGVMSKVVLLENSRLTCQQMQAMFLKNIIHQAPNIIPISMMFISLVLMYIIGSMSSVISAPPVLQTPITLGLPAAWTTAALVKNYNDPAKCKFVEILRFAPGQPFQNSYSQSKLFYEESFACNNEESFEESFNKSGPIKGRLGAVEQTPEGYTVWYNNRIFHTAAVSLNLLHNLIISKSGDYAVSVSNHPFEIQPNIKMQLSDEGLSHMVFPLILGLIMPLTISCFIFRVVEERQRHLVMLYKVAGLNLGVYWFTTLIWDFLTFIVYAIIFVIISTISTIEGYAVDSKLVIFLLLVFYAFGALPLTYLISMFSYANKITSYLIAAIVHTITGLIFFILYWDFFHTSQIFRYMVFIFPNYSLLDAVTNVYTQVKFNEYCGLKCKYIAGCRAKEVCQTIPQCCFESFFKFNDLGILPHLISLLLSGVVFLIAIFSVELYRLGSLFPTSKRLNSLRSATYPYDDRDVMALKKRLAEGDLTECKKAFYLVDQVEDEVTKKTNLLRTVSFEIKRGTCLAIYGPRNSGKSHLIKELIGEHGFIFGDIYIKGLEFKYDTQESYKSMGYCPQDQGIYNMLTGREFLTVMALVRGVQEENINAIIREISAALDMRSVMNKKAKTYNLANRRKLNVAIALLLYKDVIILDEPTTGVNGLARRVIWNVLRYARFSGKSIIFTTVDSAECEALADEVILFDQGEMFAIGSIHHLRLKFTRGFFLEVKLNRDGNTAEEAEENLRMDVENLNRFVTFLNEDSEMRSQIGSLVIFYCPVKTIIYSYLYGALEKNRRRLNISSYAISHGSMETVMQNIIQTRLHRGQYLSPEVPEDLDEDS